MKPKPKHALALALTSLLLAALSPVQGTPLASTFQYKQWVVSDPVFQAGCAGTFDDIAVKDPAIVFYNGKYHMFYTSKVRRDTFASGVPGVDPRSCSGVGYVSAPTLEGLKGAPRYNFGEIVGGQVIAPQVFYFEPHKLWYLIAQVSVRGTGIKRPEMFSNRRVAAAAEASGDPDLMPVYLTNPDIENVHGWSKPKPIRTRKNYADFWIDFWVICDEAKAHLFYTDHRGSMFRMECPIDQFPDGFKDSVDEIAFTDSGETLFGRWRMHEASHIYYVKSANKYLCLLEAVYPHPTRPNYWDSRSRFMFAVVADRLEGPWKRIETDGPNDFAGDPGNLTRLNGIRSNYDQVSHFEIIRKTHDQRFEIEDFNFVLLFQAFDSENIGDDFHYDDLPWELALMKNYKGAWGDRLPVPFGETAKQAAPPSRP